jgi:hypothetical protein
MTVEEWRRKHPKQVLGPNPEDVGQVTTDPPDGSIPEPPYPATGTSVDPAGTLSAAGPEQLAEQADPQPDQDNSQVDQQEIVPSGVPAPEESLSGPSMGSGTGIEPPEGAAVPGVDAEMPERVEEESAEEEEEDDSTPWNDMTRHAEIDEYANHNGVTTPAEWATMTIAQKQEFLDDYF